MADWFMAAVPGGGLKSMPEALEQGVLGVIFPDQLSGKGFLSRDFPVIAS